MENLKDEEIPFIDEKGLNNTDVIDIERGPDSSGPQQRLFQDSTLIPLLPMKDLAQSDNRSDCEIGGGEVLTVSSISEVDSSVKNGSNNATGGSRDTAENVLKDRLTRKTNSFKFQLHLAAEKGNVKQLEKLLSLKGDPFQTDFKNRTPLHYACGFPYQKKALRMKDIILKCPMSSDKAMDLINYQDNHGETGLHIAARTGHRLLVEKLIFSAADVNLKDKSGLEPLQLFYSKVPAAMIPVFDGALECKVGDPNDQNLILRFDFGSIVGYPDPHKDTGMFDLETKLLSYCLQQSEQKRSAILLHPVVQTFLFLKWKKIRILLWISILYHVIWLLLYTLFITELYLRQCPYKLPNQGSVAADGTDSTEADNSSYIQNGSDIIWDTDDFNSEPDLDLNITTHRNETSGVQCKIGRALVSSLNIELSFLFHVTISVVLKEMYEIYSTPQFKFYFYQLENVGQWILIGVVVLTSIPVFMTDDDNVIEIKSWQYQAAALGIFLAWSLILSQIGKIPRFAIYIEILGKVLKSFTMFMITFASLLVAFLVSFQILMPDKVEFSNFPWNFIKVMTMMAGEINYDDVFFEEDEDGSEDIPFPLSTRLLYAAFVAVVTIILFNLLIGLTVSDIQGLQSVAQLSNLSSQLEQIYLMEKFIIAKKVQRWFVRFKKNHWLRYFLVTQQTDDHETNMGVDIHISKIPPHLQYQVREIASPNVIQEEDESSVGQEDESEDKQSVDVVDEPSTKTKNIEVNEENLRKMIKDALRELLEELQVSNVNNPSQTQPPSAEQGDCVGRVIG